MAGGDVGWRGTTHRGGSKFWRGCEFGGWSRILDSKFGNGEFAEALGFLEYRRGKERLPAGYGIPWGDDGIPQGMAVGIRRARQWRREKIGKRTG